MVTLNAIVAQDNSLLIDDNQNNSANRTTLASTNTIIGTEGADSLSGTSGDDNIVALAGDDTILGTTGNDTINGGDGFDTIDYSGFGEAVIILPAGQFDDGADSLLIQVEKIVGATEQANAIDGSSIIDDSTSLDVNLANNSLVVENIPDIGSLAFEVENFVNVTGTSNNDLIVGNSLVNNLIGGDGNDLIDGGAMDDLLSGNSGEDTLIGGDGNDLIDGGAMDDLLFGNSGEDTLIGGNGKDTLDGGIGNDFLDAGASDDELFGFDGDDTLLGNTGRDTLDGGIGNDSLDGGTSDDALFGFDGDDTLLGGNGRDTLDGGVGNDLLTGGNSNDVFVLSSGSGTDIITDFGRGNNVVGLSGGISFNDLSFAGNDLILGTDTLATLNGIDTTSLSESDFITL